MTTTTSTAAGSPAGVLGAAREAIGSLERVLWAAKRPEEMLAAKRALELVRSQLAAIDADLVCEIEASNAVKADGWASPGTYLTAATGGRQGSGQATLRTSRALVSDLRLTHRALQEGRIAWPQAEVIVAVIDLLPVKPSLRAEGEQAMLESARTLNATDLKEAGKLLLELLDPDGSDKREEAALDRMQRAAHLGRRLSITDDGMGGVRVKGRGTVEDAAVIKAALFPLTKPVPASDETCDESGTDPRDHPTRMWDALVEACQQLLDTEVLPDCHGTKPRVSVTIDYADLLASIATGTLESGDTISASAIRRLACDADITPIVLGSESEVLDVGRTQRLVTAAIWKALVARDGHCTFPGCSRPPMACDAHHLVHWIDGGRTSLDNLALLCRAHHTTIHQTPWQIRMSPRDRRPDFIPPRRLDPDQRPIRTRRLRE